MPTEPIQLIVGLANPGEAYASTRHNAGAWFVEQLAKEADVILKREAKYQGLHAILPKPHACHLLVPTTFMNLSGQSVQACLRYYQLSPQTLLVAHDDIDLPAGTIRLKFDGGTGGHNGLEDIVRHLETKQFYRLRIGVGRPANSKEVADYVLHPPSKTELNQIQAALEKAYAVLLLILAGDMQEAMKHLNTNSES